MEGGCVYPRYNSPLFATVDLSVTLSMLQAEDEQHVAALR